LSEGFFTLIGLALVVAASLVLHFEMIERIFGYLGLGLLVYIVVGPMRVTKAVAQGDLFPGEAGGAHRTGTVGPDRTERDRKLDDGHRCGAIVRCGLAARSSPATGQGPPLVAAWPAPSIVIFPHLFRADFRLTFVHRWRSGYPRPRQ
jgi:hypothetical protein